MEYKNFFWIFFALIRREFILIQRGFKGALINMSVLLFTNLVVYTYLVPQLAQDENFGLFILAGSIATFGFFGVVEKAIRLMEDLEGDQRITYVLTMPIPTWLAIGHLGFTWAIESALYSLAFFPVGRLILWNHGDFSHFSIFKTLFIYLLINLFYGFFGLWLASKIKHMGEVAHIWLRVVNPLFMFGCYYYTWSSLPGIFIKAVSLFNPLVYANEGMRAAMMEKQDLLSFWISAAALTGFILFCAIDGIRTMKKRIDCV